MSAHEFNDGLLKEWRERASKAERVSENLAARVAELEAALRRVEFGNASTQHKCVACAGWDMGPNGETPKRHTKECPVGKALKGGG